MDTLIAGLTVVNTLLTIVLVAIAWIAAWSMAAALSMVTTDTQPPAIVDRSHAARCLAWALPPARRCRFVTEVVGNLAVCETREARVRYLAGIVFGLPGLCWIAYRENRRDRA